jgi:prepilin-type N-terminal cleavage/methylation domain-containing protein
MKKNIKNNNGFTIIEVLIVLAIAGLIMVVVLLAVPGLQRSQANVAARQDATHIATATSNWSDNNGGALPTTSAALVTINGDSGNMSKLTNQNGDTVITAISATAITGSGWYIAATPITAVGAAANPSTGNWSVVLDPQVTCPSVAYGPTLTLNPGGPQTEAVLYTTVTSGAPNWNCIQVQ